MNENPQITQYFSKWRKSWTDFKDRHGNKYKPSEGELNEYKKYKYELR